MPHWFDWFYFLVYLLAYSNSAINPIIYSGLNRVYEKGSFFLELQGVPFFFAYFLVNLFLQLETNMVM
jgi:hypothetical protein